MSRTGWKKFERKVASKTGGRRYPANTGGPFDVQAGHFQLQCKDRKTASLTQIEGWVSETEMHARERGFEGGVVIRRSAGAGVRTPDLVVVSLDVFRRLMDMLNKTGYTCGLDCPCNCHAKRES